MIHPDSLVKFVNASRSGEAAIITVRELFYKFIANSSSRYVVKFDDNSSVYLSSFSGYTRIKSIIRRSTTEKIWVNINPCTCNLLLSMGSRIAIYESRDHGFHGTENLKYTMKPTGYCMNNSDDNIIVFDERDKIVNTVPIVTNLFTDDVGYGYDIVTESGIVDVNQVCIDAREDGLLYI